MDVLDELPSKRRQMVGETREAMGGDRSLWLVVSHDLVGCVM